MDMSMSLIFWKVAGLWLLHLGWLTGVRGLRQILIARSLLIRSRMILMYARAYRL